MKLKKLLAGMMASAMMLTMAVPAFAKGPITDEDGITSYTLHKSYQLLGEGTSPAGTFDFTIENTALVGSSKYTAATMPTPEMTPSVTYSTGQATRNGDGTGVQEILVSFLENGELIYDSVGQYSYTLKETLPEEGLAGVEYDQDPVTMKVTVINDEAGGYKINTISFTKKGEKISGQVEGNRNEEAAFINTYSANKLNIEKTVRGDAGDKQKEFSFSVRFTGPEGKVWDASSAFDFVGAERTAAYNSAEGTWDFTLTHGQSIDFVNIPAGVTYTVVENGLDATNEMVVDGTTYTAAYDAETGTMAAEALNAKVTNTADGFIDTGVLLDNAPYVILLSVVAAGAALLFFRKRSREN